MAQLIYCGNNAAFPGLVAGTHRQGTRAECLRIGFGKGYHQPYDASYGAAFRPLDNRKIYCGNAANLPAGYDYLGNAPLCLQKGCGLGKAKRAAEGRPLLKPLLNVLLLLAAYALLFLVLYLAKPSFVIHPVDDPRVPAQIDWVRFVPWLLIFCSALTALRLFFFGGNPAPARIPPLEKSL